MPQPIRAAAGCDPLPAEPYPIHCVRVARFATQVALDTLDEQANVLATRPVQQKQQVPGTTAGFQHAAPLWIAIETQSSPERLVVCHRQRHLGGVYTLLTSKPLYKLSRHPFQTAWPGCILGLEDPHTVRQADDAVLQPVEEDRDDGVRPGMLTGELNSPGYFLLFIKSLGGMRRHQHKDNT